MCQIRRLLFSAHYFPRAAAEPEASSATQLFSVSSKPCQFPALYNGELHNDCVVMPGGVPHCQVCLFSHYKILCAKILHHYGSPV